MKPREINCIVPPHIVESVLARAAGAEPETFGRAALAPRQRSAAGQERAQRAARSFLRSLGIDQTLRAQRQALLQQRVAPGRGMGRQPRTLLRAAALLAQPTREIHDAQRNCASPPSGPIVRAEGQTATGDAVVDDCYDQLGYTYNLYGEKFDRDSIDDEGMRLEAHVHFCEGYNNAFWDGTRMVFGDGDQVIFQRFVETSVTGHELSHGVVEDEAGLVYFDQSGALNESFADVFGSLVKQFALGQTADAADWRVGDGIFTADVTSPDPAVPACLRRLDAPGQAYDDDVIGKDPQPAHMKDYVVTSADNGGVHINSGIPNHAFYQVATALGGYSWERAGRIWYDALRDSQVRSTTRFRSWARATQRAANRLFGPGEEENAVVAGWSAVGIDIS